MALCSIYENHERKISCVQHCIMTAKFSHITFSGYAVYVAMSSDF